MGARGIKETQATVGVWAADSGGIQTDLNQQGVITRLYATVEVTPSATLTSANQPDGLWRVMKNLSVQRGADTYFAQPSDDGCMGGALLHDLNLYDGFGPGHFSGSVTAPLGQANTPITFVWHAGTRPKLPGGADNPFDLSAFIPKASSRVTATWQTSGNDVMDDTVTITSANIRYTICNVIGTEEELRLAMMLEGVRLPPGAKGMVPAWNVRIVAPTATAADYSMTQDLPSGGWTKRVAILAQDATADRTLRAIDEVTGVSLNLVRAGGYATRAFVNHFAAIAKVGTNYAADDAAAAFQGRAGIGFYVLDLREYVSKDNLVGREYGINLTAAGVQGSDYQIGITNTVYAAGDDFLVLFERYMPLYAGDGVPFA